MNYVCVCLSANSNSLAEPITSLQVAEPQASNALSSSMSYIPSNTLMSSFASDASFTSDGLQYSNYSSVCGYYDSTYNTFSCEAFS